ncbi:hypothetical protein C8Q69DRAFT_67291 [Paecilomyces variotii]|uniref:Uncharacterized protein n=1 Tax=Byssochlamys spectabilis TaxID=264951 RepID=A0A443HNC3_BYSSP|nr:hypothetical protein C8Q69DRAFT_67291 [Paecilomyces variotii]KAJ9234916.1 hypothetical protein DTO169E5_6383 [Paecilomyces variotii]KAJ9312645.1 hypothetical protein DTO271D3_7036 [Paecilomyces variotii]KAJ9353914.1 hypothetical protein DTO280E4_7069 [Paecilomyces variotii]RWQ93328.1 hypothetical protein C8Q69DRAFT_67291 [Paecilomyces variotii]
MPLNKLRWVQKAKSLLRGLKEGKQAAPEDVDYVLREMDKLPVLAASSLRLSEVRDAFGLKRDDRLEEIWGPEEKDIIPVPETVLSRIYDMEQALGHDPTNEATVRWKLDIILQACVRVEQKNVAMRHPERTEKPVTLTAETHLECEIVHKGQAVILNGRSDYTMWYGDHGLDTNLVICEAKDRCNHGTGLGQCLAYMAMVHKIRKKENHINSIIYGCVTDGEMFSFLRIDNDDKYSFWHCQEWGVNPSARNKIWTHLVRITKCASALSPRTSVKKVNRVVDASSGEQKYWKIQFGSSSGMSEEEMEL